MARVVVTRRLFPATFDPLAEHEVQVWEGDGVMPREELVSSVARADGLLCMLTDIVDAELLEGAPSLRVVSQMAVGVDNVDLRACTSRCVPVGHTPDVLTETTADTAWALLAASVRRLPEGAEVVREGRWGEWDPEFLLGGELHDTVLGVVGLGRIGAAVARRAAGFAMTVLYAGPHRKPVLEAETGARHRPLPELLAEADHVVLTAPLRPDTHHMIGGAAFRAMKSTATLVNVARGGLVDHAALASALAAGEIARAALDVTEPEPLPPHHPLVALPNCLVVPHLGSASVRTRQAMADLAVVNLLAGLEGRPLRHCANPEVYG